MSPPLRLMIVDDEPLARMRLRTLLADCVAPAAEVVAEAGSAAEALHLLARQQVEGLLLDIHMPGMDGLALARRLRSQQPPPVVVFVTAHAEHALEAFEIEAVDYLTKPVRRARLQEALGRIALRRGAAVPPPAPAAPGLDEGPVLVISERGRVLRLPVREVVYLRAELKYVTLRTVSHSYVLDEPLGELEQRLGPAALRIHRNAVVNKAAVRMLERRALLGEEGEPGTTEGIPGGHGAGHNLGASEANAEGWAVQVAPTGEWLAVSRRQLVAVREAIAVWEG